MGTRCILFKTKTMPEKGLELSRLPSIRNLRILRTHTPYRTHRTHGSHTHTAHTRLSLETSIQFNIPKMDGFSATSISKHIDFEFEAAVDVLGDLFPSQGLIVSIDRSV